MVVIKSENFVQILCGDLKARLSATKNSLDEALQACVADSGYCVGVKKIDATRYSLMQRLFNYIINETYSEAYLYDRSADGPSLPNAPTLLDAKMIFNIYINGSCPESMTSDGSFCRGTVSVGFNLIFLKANDIKKEFESARHIGCKSIFDCNIPILMQTSSSIIIWISDVKIHNHLGFLL
uniref:Uncharacterized protein n=1 Tax=Panagrolaimus sp. ES5 TaxID=591445 RepID=A0AC34GWR5_9BILA